MPLTPGSMPNINEIILQAYTHLVGDYVWAFFLILAVAAVYIRTRSFGPAYMVLAVGSLILQVVLPGGSFQALVFFSVIIGIVYAGYTFFAGRR